MSDLNFLTIGDRKFFPIINFSVKKVLEFYPRSKFYIYDWGFSNSQKEVLSSYSITEIIDWKLNLDIESGFKEIITNYKGYNPKKDIRLKEYLLIQKPNCILDCTKKIIKNLIFLDGDSFLINPIDELFNLDFQVGVTILSKEMINKAMKIGVKKGINSGVIFFKMNSELIHEFVEKWLEQIKITNRIYIEQTALTLLIEQENPGIYNSYYNEGYLKILNKTIKIKTLPFELYNFFKIEDGFDINKTKILHLKGRISRFRELIIQFKLRYFISNFTKIFPKKIRKMIDSTIELKILADFIFHKNTIRSIVLILFWMKLIFFKIISCRILRFSGK